MKKDRNGMGVLGALLLFVGLLPTLGQEVEQPNEKAARYHSLLLKKPGNAMVFSRFVDAWLDTGGKKGLTAWLEAAAKEGEAADWRVLGALHEYLGEDEAALMALNAAVERDGEDADLRLSRAKMQARLLAFEAALLDLEVAAKDEKVAIEASKLKGMYLARSGQVEAAVKAWKEVIAAYPKDEDLREDLIEVEVMEGLYEDAIEASTGLVEMTKDPYQKTLRRLRLGDIQILAGNREAGLKTYEEIMAATGEGTWLEREVLAQVERVFLKEDDIKGLRDFYQKLREEHPRRVSIRKVLARQMAMNDEMKEAIALFQEVLKITPGDLGNREEFVAFLESNEKWKEAKEELVALIEQRKDDALLWERLARIEVKLNDEEALKAALAKVAELKKETAEGLLATAALYEQAELLAEAEALFREGRTSFPESLEVAEGLASFLIQNKKEEEALGIWEAMAQGADREGLLRVSRSLSSHGKGEVAFGILGERIGEFENDPLVLAQYCKLASSLEEASQAIPQGLALVNQATSPTELESAVQTALRLIARAEKKEETLKTLSEQAELGVAGQCLLSAIYAEQGDSIRAAEILTKAVDLPGGTLARFYRVKFEEDRGNLEGAIVMMRDIIEMPEGRKTVHLRRLVDLLERSGDLEKALAAVDDWKRIAPGDHAAWTRRAKLLQANGQPDDAVVELRRMIGKFGADEERRAELALALIEAAEYTPAQRIYEQLYSEAEKLESKLKWAGELAKLAAKEGKLEELLEDFDRRKRSNPSSVAPLLAIAEIHRVLNQYEERRSALLEASRRRPEDTQLLARIAEVEERAGEFDRAVGILRDAVKRDKTPESKRLLASLLLKNGEVQSGLDLLSEIPGTVNDPRGIESVVQALLSAQETEHAMSFLQKHIEKHEGDWRLKYLKAAVFKLDGEVEKALDLFTSLLRGGEEISGLKPLVAAQQANQNMGPWKALFGPNGWEELTPYQAYVSQRNYNPSNQGLAPAVALPGTPRELQLLSLLQGSSLLLKLPEKDQAEARQALSLPGIKDVDVISSLMSGDQNAAKNLLEERVKKDPDNLGLFALSLVYRANDGGISSEEFEKAEKLLLKEYPQTFAMIAFSAMRSPAVTSEKLAEALTKAMETIPQDEGEDLMEMMSFYALSPYGSENAGGKNLKPIKTLMVDQALAAVEMPKKWSWMPMVVPYLFAEEKTDEALTLINRHCEWILQDKNPAVSGWMGAMMSYGSSSQGGNLLTPPAFPPTSLQGVPTAFLSLFPVMSQGGAESEEDLAKAKLLARLQLGDRNESGQPSPKLGERANEIKNPALRALAFLSNGNEEGAQKLIEEMLRSREESSLLFAAGYLHDRDDARAYEALLKARMLPLSRESRKRVDGHLALVGSLLAEKEEVKIDLEPAKRAALRLRRILSVDERDELGEILIKLGLKSEAERLAAAPQPVITSRASGGMSSIRDQQERITELRKAGNIDGAAREAAKQFRSLSNGRNNEWELRELKEKLTTKELKEETLKKLDPGESESTKRLLEFAKAQQLIGTKEKAREVFEKVLAKDADHVEARVGAITNTPFSEIDESEIIVRKNDEIDVAASALIFDRLWSDSSTARDLEHYAGLCKLTASFLETLPSSSEASRNLSWVPFHILDFASETSIGEVRMSALVDSGNGYQSGSSSLDLEAVETRNTAVKEVFLAMLKHPQIAEQGFMLLESAREGLALEDDEMVELARAATLKLVEKEEGGNRFASDRLWSKWNASGGSHSSGELNNPQGPMTWLIAHAAKTDMEILTPELAEKIKKAQPERFALLEEARALANAEPEEAEKRYAAWKEKLPELKREKAIEFARQMLLFSPKDGPWADDLESLMLDSSEQTSGSSFGSGSNEMARLVRDWGSWRHRAGGAKKYEAFLLRLYEDSFGPRDQWEILAKLGEDELPQKYRQAGYGFQQINRALFNDSSLVKSTLLFMSKHPLEEFVYDLDDAIQGAWAPSYPSVELALKTILENGVLTTDPQLSAPSPEHFLMVAERGSQIRFSSSNRKVELGDLLLKAEGLHPLLQNVAAASLFGSRKGGELLQPFLEKDIATLKAVAESYPERSFEVFRRWYPEMEESEVSAPLRELFAEFAGDARAKKVAIMEAWLKDGVPGIAKKDEDEFWTEFLGLVPMDEDLSFQVLDRVLKDVHSSKNSGTSSRNGVVQEKLDLWLESLSEQLQSTETDLDLPQRVRLLDRVYRGELGPSVLEPMALRSYNSDWAWKMFLNAAKSAPKDAKKPLLFQCLSELNSGQQATLLVLWSDGVMNASTEDLSLLKKHQRALSKRSQMLTYLLRAALNHRLWKNTKGETNLKKARQNYFKILESEQVPIALKVDLLHRINKRASVLHSGPEIFQKVSEIMAAYGQEKRNHAASSLSDTVAGLANLDFPGVEGVAGEIAEQAEVLFLSREAMAARRSRELPEVAKSIVTLAMKSDRIELASGILRKNYAAYRGNLSLMCRLAQAGEFEILRKLVVAKTARYDTADLASYDQEFHLLTEKILQEIPEENRYHARVVLSDCLDLAKGGEGDAHETPRNSRIEKLARDFGEKGSQLQGDARLQVLAIFADDDASAVIVEEALGEVFERTAFAESILFKENSSSMLKSDAFEIMKRVLHRKIMAKEFLPIKTKLEEFLEAIEADGQQAWKLRYIAGPVFGAIGQELINLAAQSPEDAEATLPETKAFFDLAIRVQVRRSPMHCLDGVSLIVHALAGKSADWKLYLESHPQKKRYQEELKKRDAYDQFEDLGSDHWRSPEMAGARARVLQAMFDSDYYHERDLQYLHDYYGLSRTKLYTFEEFVDAAEALPADHPRKMGVMYHCAGLKSYHTKEKSAEKGIAAYTEVLEMAREAGNEDLMNQVLAHRCHLFYNNKKRKEAQRDAAQIKMDQLPARDRKWVEKSLPKWLEG